MTYATATFMNYTHTDITFMTNICVYACACDPMLSLTGYNSPFVIVIKRCVGEHVSDVCVADTADGESETCCVKKRSL